MRVQDGESGSIWLEVLVNCVLFARDGVRIAAVAPLVVSVYYLCHHVLPRRHPRVISPRDAPSADRASRRTVARARSAENLRIELLSWGVQKPPDHPPGDLHALDANGQGRAPSWRFMVTEERALVSVIGPTAGSGVRIEH